MTTKLVLCDCAGTFSPDREALEKATGMACSRVFTGLCHKQLGEAARLIEEADGEIVFACRQEEDTFAALADELDKPAPRCIDLRDRAGWSDKG